MFNEARYNPSNENKWYQDPIETDELYDKIKKGEVPPEEISKYIDEVKQQLDEKLSSKPVEDPEVRQLKIVHDDLKRFQEGHDLDKEE